MSEIRLNILEAGRAVSGTTHAADIDRVVAALSANPATIEELQSAMARFAKPLDGFKPFELFDAWENETPWDAGISFVDLETRVVATESTYSYQPMIGYVRYHDGTSMTDVRIEYHVPDDWLLLNSIEEYKGIRDLRLARIAASPPLDARAVLYGAVAEFVVLECIAAKECGKTDPIAGIHAKWLMTPRDDLRGQCPRGIMFRQRDFIDADLQSREDQWGLLHEPPPCLDETSFAYRFAGFGTHEFVVYYDLVRYLISQCWKRVQMKRPISIPDETARLRQLQSKWLHRPEESFENKSAAYIIECERKRLPLAVSPEDAYFDEGCPLCREMAKQPGPTFCHFDGSHMDEGFPFSLFSTQEEWEEDKQFLAEMGKELNSTRHREETEPSGKADSPAGDPARTIH